MSEKPTYAELEQRVQALEKADFERKQAELEWQRNERLFNDTQHLAKIGGWELDLENQTTFWTHEVFRIHDLQPDRFALLENNAGNGGSDTQSKSMASIDEAVKLSMECYDPEDRPAVMEAFRKCVEEGQPYDLEFPFRTVKGRRIWIRTIANPIKKDGRVVKVVGNFMDITDRKQSEEAVKRKESIQRKVIANMGDVIVIIDQDGINRYKSPNIEKLFGWKPEELVGRSTWEIVHPEDLASALHFMDRLMREPDAVGTTECRYKCGDGSYRWIEFTGCNLLHDPDINGILGNYHEITSRKAAEEQLFQSEENYRILAENPNSIVMRFDAQGNIIYVNKYASELFGYTVEEMIGHKSTDLIHHKKESERARAKEFFSDLLANPEKYRTNENENVTKDGRSLWISWTNTPTFEEDGTFSGLISTGFDITERKRTEEERKKIQIQLNQAQKMESIGTLAGGIAHDFNNILAALIGYAELLKFSLPRDSMELDNANQILKAGNRAKELVQQILTFSRQTEKEFVPVSISMIVKEVAKLLRSTLPATIEIRHNIQSDALVMGDPTQIHQILMNLCTNAGHAMREKGGLLTIDLDNLELEENLVSDHITLLPGTYVTLRVTDTGHGIPAEYRDRIFDPFFTTKEQGEGTGMGLSVVHGIVKSYKGAIYAYSDVGKGTSFKIFLPAIEKRIDTEKRVIDDIPKGSEHILLVDDESVLLEMGTTQLETLGYKVTSRSNGREALKLFEAKPDCFDLVVTDMTMPKMTGDQLASALKKIRPDIPIILCTGFSTKLTSENAHQFDIDALLMKPVILREMAGIIRSVLD